MKFNYVPPMVGMRTAAHTLAVGGDIKEEMSLLPGEEDALKETVRAGAPG